MEALRISLIVLLLTSCTSTFERLAKRREDERKGHETKSTSEQ